jgi:hypothetical protein
MDSRELLSLRALVSKMNLGRAQNDDSSTVGFIAINEDVTTPDSTEATTSEQSVLDRVEAVGYFGEYRTATTLSGNIANVIEFLVDTGASEHMTGTLGLLTNTKPCHNSIRGFNGMIEHANVCGRVCARMMTGRNVVISDVLYVKALGNLNLFSMKKAIDAGARYVSSSEGSWLLQGNVMIPLERTSNGLWILKLQVEYDNQALVGMGKSEPSSIDVNVLHCRYGHVQTLKSLHTIANNLGMTLSGTLQSCVTCGLGKLQKIPMAKVTAKQSTTVFERLFIDIRGPVDSSIGGNRHALFIVDGNCRKKWTYFLRSKNDNAQATAIQSFFDTVVGSNSVLYVRCDNAFVGPMVRKLFATHGIQVEYTSPDTPEQNSVVERSIMLVFRAAMMMLHYAGLLKSHLYLWAEAVNYACVIANNSPHAFLKYSCPDQVFYGSRYRPPRLRVFGCLAIVFNTNRAKATMDLIGEEALFVGIAPDKSRGGRFYKLRTKSIVETAHFIIYEDKFLNDIRTPNGTISAPDDNFLANILANIHRHIEPVVTSSPPVIEDGSTRSLPDTPMNVLPQPSNTMDDTDDTSDDEFLLRNGRRIEATNNGDYFVNNEELLPRNDRSLMDYNQRMKLILLV